MREFADAWIEQCDTFIRDAATAWSLQLGGNALSRRAIPM